MKESKPRRSKLQTPPGTKEIQDSEAIAMKSAGLDNLTGTKQVVGRKTRNRTQVRGSPS